jgi:hypothetical protein
MPWRGPARASKLLAGTVLSGVAVISGLWFCENTSPILAVGPVAAGLYVLMYMVADDLVPGASPTATGFMKLTVALVFFGWVPLAFWSLWTGSPI